MLTKKPNILLIVTDQQRWDALGCAGGWVRTPHIDSIGREGIRFSACVTNSPMCVPARVSLATGLYPHNTQVWKNIPYTLPTEYSTWMRSLRDAGYRTSVFGKTHLHVQSGDLRKAEHLLREYGFDDVDEIAGPRASVRVRTNLTEKWESKGLWQAYRKDIKDRLKNNPYVALASTVPLEDYPDTYVGQQAQRYLANYDRKEPWFCWVGFSGPHEPWDAPEPYASMYDPADMPLPVERAPDTGKRNRGVLDRRLKRAPKVSSSDIAALRANYAGNVTLIDDQVGQILEVVRERGEEDDTVVVFTSDHGEMNGDYGLFYKGVFLNGAVRIPLLIRTPTTIRNGVVDEVYDGPVEWFDIGPTLVDLAGGEQETGTFGKSLVGVLDGSPERPRRYAVSECLGEVMYFDKDWKLCLNQRGLPYLLFDLEQDPNETTNRVRDKATKEVQTKLRLKILKHILKTQVQLGRLTSKRRRSSARQRVR